MAQVGDTVERFGRSYIFLNPDPTVLRNIDAGVQAVPGTVGTWRLRVDDEGTPPINGGGGADLTYVVTIGGSDDVEVGNLIYIDDQGFGHLADASDISTADVAGMATQSGTPGTAIKISRNEPESIFAVSNVVDGGPTFLTPGALYYLSTNPGKWTTTPDTTTPGAVVRSCGYALDGNKMSVEIQVATVI